jgi:AbrB family looped-hinge helix DNA binding protein
MEKELTTLSSKGQLVIPKSFRQKLGLKSGDFIGMVLMEDMVAIKKLDMETDKISRRVSKAADKEFNFQELLYPEK